MIPGDRPSTFARLSIAEEVSMPSSASSNKCESSCTCLVEKYLVMLFMH